jgi:hypothetical protein
MTPAVGSNLLVLAKLGQGGVEFPRQAHTMRPETSLGKGLATGRVEENEVEWGISLDRVHAGRRSSASRREV